MSKIGRNDPCPCGSGKKYKKCCINGPSKHRQEIDEGPKAMEIAAEWLEEHHYEDLMFSIEGLFLQDIDTRDIPEELEELISLNAFEWAPLQGFTMPEKGRIPLIDLVLGFQGPALSPPQRKYLEKARSNPLNLYEVQSLKPNRLVVKELFPLEGDRPRNHEIYSPDLSDIDFAPPGTVLGLRLIPGDPWLNTNCLYLYSPASVPGILNRLDQANAIAGDELERRFLISKVLIDSWLKSTLGTEPLNLFDELTGERMHWVIDYYKLDDEQLFRQKMRQASEVEQEDDSWALISCRADGEQTPIAHFDIDDEDGELVVEVFSRFESHSEQASEWIEKHLENAMTYIRGQVIDPAQLAPPKSFEKAEPPAAANVLDGMTPRERTEFMEQLFRKSYSNWADEPVPALDDKTPRQAITTDQGRQKVIDLLASYDQGEERDAMVGGRYAVSFNFLRQELGLPEV